MNVHFLVCGMPFVNLLFIIFSNKYKEEKKTSLQPLCNVLQLCLATPERPLDGATLQLTLSPEESADDWQESDKAEYRVGDDGLL